MENNICKHWLEDDYGYGSKEICKGNNNKLCTCSGVKEQCNYPEYYRQEELEANTFDIWLYPEQLDNENIVVNIFYNETHKEYQSIFYTLPDDWREQVTKDKGLDGKPSIHDLMDIQ